MNPFLTFVTILCVFGISVGQMLFKKAAMAIPSANQWQQWVFNGWLLGALALYGLTTLGWVWILRHAPLHLAYPFMGLAFFIVPCLSWIFLNEPLRISTILGGSLILVGVAITSHA